MTTLEKSELVEGEWYHDKEYTFNFESISYENTVDTDYWYLSGEPVIVLERHPADQKTKSKSVKCVFKSNTQQLEITSVETNSQPIEPDSFNSVEEEIKSVEQEVLENLFIYNGYQIENINVNNNTLTLDCYHPYEYGNLKFTIKK